MYRIEKSRDDRERQINVSFSKLITAPSVPYQVYCVDRDASMTFTFNQNISQLIKKEKSQNIF